MTSRATIDFDARQATKAFPFVIGAARWEPSPELRKESELSLPEKMDFDVNFRTGGSLIDRKYENLLRMSQMFLREVYNTRAAISFYVEWRHLVPFITYAIEVRGVTDFEKMWETDAYVAYIKARITLNRHGWSREPADSAVKPETLYPYILTVKNLWQFSCTMKHGLRDEPWPGRSAGQVAQLKSPLVNAVMPYTLEEFAGFVKLAISDLNSIDALCADLIARVGEDDFIEIVKRITLMRTAATIVIHALGSLRPKEVLRLECKCLVAGMLKTDNRSLEVSWLDGRIYKDKPAGGESHRWLAAEEIVIAVTAMQKLRVALDECIRKKLLPPAYLKALVQSRRFLLPKIRLGGKNSGVSTKTSLLYLKEFTRRPECKLFLRESTVVSYQRFRPTLARVFARLELGDMRYFMQHWGHTFFRTTNGYFATFADDEFRSEVRQHKEEQFAGIVDQILSSSKPLLGGKGAKLEPLRRKYAVMTFKSKKEITKQIVRGNKLRIGPQSYCMADNDTKLCSQDCLYDETLCLDCHNGVVTDAHLETWEDIRTRSQALVDEFEPGSPAGESSRANLKHATFACKKLSATGGAA